MPEETTTTALDGVLTRLVPTTEDDLDLLAGWFASPDFVAYWGGVPLTRAEVAEKYVGRRRPRVQSYLVLAEGAPVGYAQFWHADATEDGTEDRTEGSMEGGIDLVLQPASQGRGFGPDATRALLAHLGGELGWRRVTADPVRENVRAVRAWEKAGFRQVPSETGELVLEFRFLEGRQD
ncbi:GNAT family N-acetyltransferase [Streptomyces sp. TRM75563]|uniref:GNAT family N-acetyltransferase n=1 Tax=Streptomyces sp. TRM75563 TaxID=2817418 RepID=UPI001F606BBE|nr:GNAT family N-acetyltransferase [Streptomyces sp. TRM75563]MCI4042500.1 GNAT family N-acetyltransferase [Streptomyces sp. TRM75563]